MSKIYKLYSDYSDDFYIGSTTKHLNQRLSLHKTRAKKGETNKLHKTMLKLGISNWKIIELINCDNSEKYDTEDIFICMMNPSLNTKRGNTGIKRDSNYNKNYYNKYKSELSDKAKIYYQNNKESKQEYQRQYYRRKTL